MATRLALSLQVPTGAGARADPETHAPPAVPTRLDDTGGALNDAVLVAEGLGVDSEEALLFINSVWNDLADLGRASFTDDVLPGLRDWLVAVTAGLREGVDDGGLPRGLVGARLAARDAVETNARGQLVLRRRERPLTDLRADLESLLRMVEFALTHHLSIAMTQE